MQALHPDFQSYQEQVVKNARCMVDTLISHGYTIVSGGTDTHLCVLDLRPKVINRLKVMMHSRVAPSPYTRG